MSPICVSEGSVSTPVVEPPSMIGEASFVVIEGATFSHQITTAQLRIQKIKKTRNGFAALTLLLAVATGVCFYNGVPYQPFVASGIATLGSTVVLWMKAMGR